MKNIFKIMFYVFNKNTYESIFIKYIHKYRLNLKNKIIITHLEYDINYKSTLTNYNV